LVDAVHVRDRVTFLGALGHDQVTQRYGEADVFCLASFREGVPTVLMEAMASGVPVVTTRIAGVAELVDDGRSGMVVSPGRPDQLAEALSYLASNREERLAIGESGRRRIQDDYAIERAAGRLEQLFRDLRADAPVS
jgi:glycosyltransferase involved in cell wall biosynthesis